MDRFDAYLHSLFQDDIPSTVLEAMQYSLFAGGKRVRPQLLLLALETWLSYGGRDRNDPHLFFDPRRSSRHG